MYCVKTQLYKIKLGIATLYKLKVSSITHTIVVSLLNDGFIIEKRELSLEDKIRYRQRKQNQGKINILNRNLTTPTQVFTYCLLVFLLVVYCITLVQSN